MIPAYDPNKTCTNTHDNTYQYIYLVTHNICQHKTQGKTHTNPLHMHQCTPNICKWVAHATINACAGIHLQTPTHDTQTQEHNRHVGIHIYIYKAEWSPYLHMAYSENLCIQTHKNIYIHTCAHRDTYTLRTCFLESQVPTSPLKTCPKLHLCCRLSSQSFMRPAGNQGGSRHMCGAGLGPMSRQ